MRTATCGSGDRPGCGEPIWWLRHELTGKTAPIDVAPNSAGNILVDPVNDTYSVLAGKRLAQARDDGVTLRLNHFVTCPLRQSFSGN